MASTLSLLRRPIGDALHPVSVLRAELHEGLARRVQAEKIAS